MIDKAAWLFPLYLIAINIFVLPIAFGGQLHFAGAADPDTFVLILPLSEQQRALALLVFSTNFPSRFYWTGGAFLRWDWLFWMIASACLLKK